MIGKVIIGKSFGGCLAYCLNDKQQVAGEEKVMEGRSDLLLQNLCFGSQSELIQQFNEVRKLNLKVTKPVMHITLSFAHGESLPKNKLMEVAEKCASELRFQNNLFVAVMHKDTSHAHMHIVANRVGLDGHTLSDSNSYKKIAAFCRRMEKEYKLQEVQSPRKFQSGSERKLPRLDTRKLQIKKDVGAAVAGSKSYAEFEQKLKAKGYDILKGRGIAFIDPKKVKVKGSDIGYSLATIERILGRNRLGQLQTPAMGATSEKDKHPSSNADTKSENTPSVGKTKELEISAASKLLDALMKLENDFNAIEPLLLQKNRKKKKRRPRL